MASLGMFLALTEMVVFDGLGFLAAAVLISAAGVSATAAFAHEGLVHEVTDMATQNDLFAEKNVKLAESIAELSEVSARLDSLQNSLGARMGELEDTLGALHSVTATTQLVTLLRAFTDADSARHKDQRLTDEELTDFFDTSGELLHLAAPDFDFALLKSEATTVGIGLYAMRFLVNAVIASGDDVPGKSTAELALMMFSINPERHFEECLAALRMVLKTSEEELRSMLQAKRQLARPDEHNRIPCKDLMDISRLVMTCGP